MTTFLTFVGKGYRLEYFKVPTIQVEDNRLNIVPVDEDKNGTGMSTANDINLLQAEAISIYRGDDSSQTKRN